MSFKKQLHIFYNADIILSTHGGAITNSIFCTPHTVLIECDPPYFYEMSYTVNAMISQVHFILVSTFTKQYLKDKMWQIAESAYKQGEFGVIHKRYVNLNVNPPLFNLLSAITDAINYVYRWRYEYEVTDKWSPIFYFYYCYIKVVI